MQMPTDPNLGYMIRGYRLEEMLKKGKMTTLYHARTKEIWLPPELSVMLLHIPTATSETARINFKERFTREARRLIKLRHPSLSPLFGYGEEKGQFYLLFPPQTTASTLAERLQIQKLWTPAETFGLLAPISKAFDYIHSQNITYQFFSPSNILLQDNDGPQLTDTGLPQLLLAQGLAEETRRNGDNRHLRNIIGEYLNSPAYLAPEVVRGEPVTARSDIYSLGILLFELLSGQPPFRGTSYMEIAQKHIREPLPVLHTIAPQLPIALELVVNRALHRDPERRYATAGDLTTALANTLDKRLHTSTQHAKQQTFQPRQTSPLQEFVSEPLLDESQQLQPEVYYGSQDKITEPALIDLSSVPDEHDEESAPATSTRLSGTSDAHSDMEKMAQHLQEIRRRIQGDRK